MYRTFSLTCSTCLTNSGETPAEADRIVHRGDLQTNSFSVWWLSGNRLVAAFTMNRPDEERELAPQLIQSKRNVMPERLREAVSVHDLAKGD